MKWVTLNRLFTFIGPRLRAFFLLLPPTSITASNVLGHWIPRGPQLGITLSWSIAFYASALATYYCARLVHNLFCPDRLRGIAGQQDFYERETKLLENTERLVAKRRQVEEGIIEAELIGVLDKATASKLAVAISAKVHTANGLVPYLDVGINDISENKTAMAVSYLLVILCGSLYLTSSVLAFLPIFHAVSPSTNGIRQ